MSPCAGEVVIEAALPVDLPQTLGALRRAGSGDPTVVLGRTEMWRASRYPAGPATVHVASLGPRTVRVRAWGPGSDDALLMAPSLVGAHDDDGGLSRDGHPLIRGLARRFPGLRLSATGNPFEALVPTVLEQKVQGIRARRSYRAMIRAAGERAPTGPGGPQLLLPPSPRWLMRQPQWAWHRWDVEEKRAGTIRTAASYAHRLTGAPDLVRTRLAALPGIGAWTVAEVEMVAFADPDAVSVGDYWLKHWVAHNLGGEVRGTDDRMLELLRPWAGQRGRVCRLITSGGAAPPRFGPRLELTDIRGL